MISPNGKWLAYQSNKGGLPEIFVRPFPSGPGQWQVGSFGARSPRWRGDGKELFFRTGRGGGIVAVDVTVSGERPQFGAAKELFSNDFNSTTHVGHHDYAVSRDGQRFVVTRAREASSSAAADAPIAVVVNWFEGLPR